MTIDKTKIRKPCPEPDCNGELIIRTNRHNGTEFMGCTRWPACTHTEEVPEWLRMIAVGAAMLPGME